MKRKIIFILCAISLQQNIKSQENSLNNGIGIGFQLVQYQQDFGYGINLISPYIAKKSVAFRLKTNIMFNQYVKDSVTDQANYQKFSLGLIGIGGKIGDNIRLYGEGGIVGVLPSNTISSPKQEFGGYGLFGFEFFFSKGGNYFIEIGGVGIGTIADKLPNKPIYSNGLIISTGFRFFLK